MNKTAQFLTKWASLAAVQKKRYWQMLKRLHGGTEEAVRAIKETGDSGIYHGTRESKLYDITQEGLKAGPFREFGKGVFFGTKEIAERYGKPDLFSSSGNPLTALVDNKNVIDSPSTISKYLKNHPGVTYDKGALVRLKKPSELEGKINYPDPQSLKVFGVKKGKGLHSVDDNYPYLVDAPGAKRLQRIYSRKLEKLDEPEIRKEYIKALKENPKDYSKEIERLTNNPDSHVHPDWVSNFKAENLILKRGIPQTDKQYNQLVYYGRDNKGDQYLEKLSPNRREFFSEETVAPELLKIERGVPQTPPAKETKKPVESVVDKIFPTRGKGEVSRRSVKKPIENSSSQSSQKESRDWVLPMAAGVGGLGTIGVASYHVNKFLNRKKEE